jgi:hypothetical protein
MASPFAGRATFFALCRIHPEVMFKWLPILPINEDGKMNELVLANRRRTGAG